MSERKFTRMVDRSLLPWVVNFCLANVKHSEAMRDEITACGASIFVFVVLVTK